MLKQVKADPRPQAGQRLKVIIESDDERNSLREFLRAREVVNQLLTDYHAGGPSQPAAAEVREALGVLAEAQRADDAVMGDLGFAMVEATPASMETAQAWRGLFPSARKRGIT